MGCFDVNCSVSGLSIKADEEIIVIPVFTQCSKNVALTAYVDNKEVFIPVTNANRHKKTELYGIPFRACYDEYGWFYFNVEHMEQYGWTWLIEHIKRCNIRVPANPSACRKSGFEPLELQKYNAIDILKYGVFDKSVFVDWMQVYLKNTHIFAGLIYELSFVFIKPEIMNYAKRKNKRYSEFLEKTITEFLTNIHDVKSRFNEACLIEDSQTKDHAKADVLMGMQFEYSRFGNEFYAFRAENPIDFVTARKDNLMELEILFQAMKDIALLTNFMEGVGRKLSPIVALGQFTQDKELFEFNQFVNELIAANAKAE